VRFSLLVAAFCGAALAQQPFFTDDADVTTRHRFHLEVSNQQSWLQRSALPATKQNTTVFQVNYGLTKNFEIGMDGPLIFLYQQQTPVTYGPGDFNVTFKLRMYTERVGSPMPATTLSCAIETPTGSVRKQLGSGVPDYGCNNVLQKKVGPWTWRLNNGLIFSGNTLTGVIGLKTTGLVYLGAGSITRQVHPRLVLGAELFGTAARKATALGKGNLLTQFGGKFTVQKGFTLDFGYLHGWLAGAPRDGVQLGISKDF